jgi:hypothetical protein
MKRNNRRLYESIMKDVSKKIKRHLNENMNPANEDIIDTIIDCLSEHGILYDLAEQVSTAEIEDPHVFTDNEFLQQFGERLSDEVSTIYFNEFD